MHKPVESYGGHNERGFQGKLHSAEENEVILPTILLVEDNEDDVFVMKYALRKSGISNPFQVVTDGQMGVDYLAGSGEYADRERFPMPFIVFLDLKLPYVHGFEVLSWIRQQPELSSIIVVVLTGSAETKDQAKAYALGARSYLVKPPTPETLKDIFDALNSLCLSKESEGPLISAKRPEAATP